MPSRSLSRRSRSRRSSASTTSQTWPPSSSSTVTPSLARPTSSSACLSPGASQTTSPSRLRIRVTWSASGSTTQRPRARFGCSRSRRSPLLPTRSRTTQSPQRSPSPRPMSSRGFCSCSPPIWPSSPWTSSQRSCMLCAQPRASSTTATGLRSRGDSRVGARPSHRCCRSSTRIALTPPTSE
eukprot:Amastigsp_a250_252.p3 type:complete len:182 gc:universal Amastigsp_a250_252:767-222(-)